MTCDHYDDEFKCKLLSEALHSKTNQTRQTHLHTTLVAKVPCELATTLSISRSITGQTPCRSNFENVGTSCLTSRLLNYFPSHLSSTLRGLKWGSSADFHLTVVKSKPCAANHSGRWKQQSTDHPCCKRHTDLPVKFAAIGHGRLY